MLMQQVQRQFLFDYFHFSTQMLFFYGIHLLHVALQVLAAVLEIQMQRIFIELREFRMIWRWVDLKAVFGMREIHYPNNNFNNTKLSFIIITAHSLFILSRASLNQNVEAVSINSSLKLKRGLCRKTQFYSFLVQKKKNAPGLIMVQQPKSSLALKGKLPLPTLSSPKYYLATLNTLSDSFLLLAVKQLSINDSSTLKPSAQISAQTDRILSLIFEQISASNVLVVPQIVTDSEITLYLQPDWKTGKVQTKNFPDYYFSFVVKSIIFWQNYMPFPMATFKFQGQLPCPPVPIIFTLMMVILLITGPSLHQISPNLPIGQLWNPQTSSTSYRHPFSMSNSAP